MKHLDPRSIVITALVLPLLWYFLKRIRRFFKEYLSRLLEALFWAGGRIFNRSFATRVSLRQYARIQLGKRGIQFLTVPGAADTSLPIDQVFVPLQLEDPSGSRSMRTDLDFFDRGARLRIVGDPGSGKSSLVKRVFRDACQRSRKFRNDTRKVGFPPVLPVLVDLKQFSPPDTAATDAECAAWGIEQLRGSVAGVQGFGMQIMFDSFMTGRGLLVLFDGLDEVASASYQRAAQTICAVSDFLADQSEHNTVVITMRSQFHHQIQADFAERFPDLLYIEPFNPADIYKFLTRWPYREDPDSAVTRIYAELTDRPTLRDMCRNPLVLAMYVASDQRREDASKADVRASFYNHVVGELLVKRRSRQRQTATHTAMLSQREAIFGQLAYDNLIDPVQDANSISRRAALQKVAHARNISSDDDANRELDELASETGIIDEERPGESLHFIHLTFCEFLAAKYAARHLKGGWETLLRRHTDFQTAADRRAASRLLEVIPFAVALLTPADQPDAIDQVATLGDQRVLGRCFLESQAYTHPRWADYVRAEMASLLATPAADWTEAWLQRLQLFTVVVRDAQAWGQLAGHPIGVAIERMFSNLVGYDRQRLSRVFSSFATHDPAAAFRLADDTGLDLALDQPELVIGNASDPPFLDIAVERALATPSATRRWAPLLAEAALRRPAVAARLVARPAPSSCAAALAEVPRQLDWSWLGRTLLSAARAPYTKPSCYGVFIAVALNSAPEIWSRYSCLAVLQMVPPPQPLSRVRLLLMPLILLITVSLAVVVVILEPVYRTALDDWMIVALQTMMMVVALAMLTVSSMPTERMECYRILTNLSPHTSPRSVMVLLSPQVVTRRFLLRRLNAATAMMVVARDRPLPGAFTERHPGQPVGAKT